MICSAQPNTCWPAAMVEQIGPTTLWLLVFTAIVAAINAKSQRHLMNTALLCKSGWHRDAGWLRGLGKVNLTMPKQAVEGILHSDAINPPAPFNLLRGDGQAEFFLQGASHGAAHSVKLP